MDYVRTSGSTSFSYCLARSWCSRCMAASPSSKLGTVRGKNQVNAMVKIIVDFAFSTLAYFFIGYWIAYGVAFLRQRRRLCPAAAAASHRRVWAWSTSSSSPPSPRPYRRSFRAALPNAPNSGRRSPQPPIIVGLIYPLREGIVWNANYGIQAWLDARASAPRLHDFAGSIVVHAVGGWLALAAVLRSAPAPAATARMAARPRPPRSPGWRSAPGCCASAGSASTSCRRNRPPASPASSPSTRCWPWSAASSRRPSSRKADPGFVHNGALAGLVAVCAGSDVMHPIGALIVGGVAGAIFVYGFTLTQERLKIDDVLGVWPLHGLCGLWGGIAAGIFGLEALGGMGGVSPVSQILGSVAVVGLRVRRGSRPLHPQPGGWSASGSPTSSSAAAPTSPSTRSAQRRTSSEHRSRPKERRDRGRQVSFGD